MRGNITKKIPLIFWFPGFAHSGRLQQNVSLLSVAPTILDYTGSRLPHWMEGASVLSDEIRSCKRILTGSAGPWDKDFSYVLSDPPFFSLWQLTMIVCDRFYTLDLVANKLRKGFIEGHKGECNQCERISETKAREFFIDHLKQAGYDTASINR